MPTAAALACALVLAWKEYGSFVAAVWLPYAALVALLLAVVLGTGTAARPSRAACIATAALLGVAAWIAVSLSWSAVPTLARDEALMALLYALALAVPVLTLKSSDDRHAASGLLVASLAGLAFAAELKLLTADRPAELYHEGRLYFPIDYGNAQSALFLIGFWPAVALAARATAPVVLRAGAVAGACSLLCGWILVQSKGGGLGLIVSAIVVISLSPRRLRLLLAALLAAAPAAAMVEPLTAPFRADAGEPFRDAVRGAGAMSLTAVGIALVAGLVYSLADRRIVISRRANRVLSVVTLCGLILGIAAGVGAFLIAVDRPGHELAERWRAFKTPAQTETGGSHFLTLGSNRYDFWRVALDEFADHPIAGIGARGFSAAYLRERRSDETPQRAHSLELDQLSETGVVGFALLAVALMVPLVSIARARASLLAAGLLGAGTYWLAHASVDWIWTFPAATIPLFLILGIGLAQAGRPPALSPRWAVAGAAACVAIAFLIFMPPWLSSRFTRQAAANPADATTNFRWARRLDPLSTEPLVTEAHVRGAPANIPLLRRAVEKEPRRAELHYLLGRAYLEAGRRRDARRELRTARNLHPRDRLIEDLLRRAG